MKALSILILATVLCGHCDCQTILDKLVPSGIPLLSSLSDNAVAISRLPVQQIYQRLISLEHYLTHTAEQYAAKLNGAQRNIIDTILRIARNFFASIESGLRSVASYYGSPINGAVTFAENDSSGTRIRKSILPIQSLENMFGGLSADIGDRIESAVMGLVKWMFNFLRTRGLPWLHSTLDNVATLKSTPSTVRTLIQNFDAIYSLLQLFGYL